MKNFIRGIVLILIVWSLVAQFYYLSVLLCLWYLYKYRGYELVIISVLIDGYYQAFYAIPWLSIISVVVVFLVDIIKPQLLMYTGDNEVVS